MENTGFNVSSVFFILLLLSDMTCTPKVRQKTFGVLLCLKSTGNMAMQND